MFALWEGVSTDKQKRNRVHEREAREGLVCLGCFFTSACFYFLLVSSFFLYPFHFIITILSARHSLTHIWFLHWGFPARPPVRLDMV